MFVGSIIMALNRLNDYLFKWLFGQEDRKPMLLDLINAVLTDGSDENIIVDFEFKDRELDPQKLKDKEATLDILGKTSDGTLINIEVQVENQHDIDHRMLYYWAKNYSLQLMSGEEYTDLKPTICICIMNFNYFPRDRYHSCYNVLERLDHQPLNNDMNLHFIELKKWADLKRKPLNRLERWLLYLANNNPKELEEAAYENRYIASALAAEVNFGLDDNDRYWYDMREKFLMDQGSINAKVARVEKEAKEAKKEAKEAKKEAKEAKNKLKEAKAEAEKFKALYEQLLNNKK